MIYMSDIKTLGVFIQKEYIQHPNEDERVFPSSRKTMILTAGAH